MTINKALLVLGDYAVVAEGKLTVVGAGWNFTGPDPTPSAIGILLDVPWDQTNRKHAWSLVLKDTDGNAFTDPAGNPLALGGEFEAGRAAGHPVGTAATLPLAINIGPLPLDPSSRYIWELTIDDEGREDWSVAFNTQPRPGPTRMVS